MAKDTTINELARMTANGFNDVMQRLGGVQETVNSHTVNLHEIKSDIQKIKAAMLELAYKYEIRNLGDRVAKIEKAIGLIK